MRFTQDGRFVTNASVTFTHLSRSIRSRSFIARKESYFLVTVRHIGVFLTRLTEYSANTARLLKVINTRDLSCVERTFVISDFFSLAIAPRHCHVNS